MANFCRFCGSPLEEGQVCACQGAQQEAYQAQQAYQAAPVAAAAPAATAAPAAPGLGNKLIETLKNYWKAPKATAAAVAEDKQGMAIGGIFAGVNFLAIFFFIWRFIGAWITVISDGDPAEWIEDAEFAYPILPMLVSGLVIAALGIFVTALVVFVIAKLNKQEADLKQLIVFESVHSLVPTALLVVGILLSFLVWWFLIVVLALILVLWLVNLCSDISGSMDNSKNMLIHTGVIAVALLVIVCLSSVLTNWSCGAATVNDGDVEISEQFEDTNMSIWHAFIVEMMVYED